MKDDFHRLTIYGRNFSLPHIHSKSLANLPKNKMNILRNIWMSPKKDSSKKKIKPYVDKTIKTTYEAYFDEGEERINIHKRLKNIRDKIRNSRPEDFLEDTIPYSKSNIDLIKDSKRIINQMKQREDAQLEKEENSVFGFLTERREISKSNAAIHQLNSEKKKIKRKIFDRKNFVTNIEDKLTNEKDVFEKYKDQIRRIQIADNNYFMKVLRIKELQETDKLTGLYNIEEQLKEETKKSMMKIYSCLKYCKFIEYIFGGEIKEVNEAIEEIKDKEYQILEKYKAKPKDSYNKLIEEMINLLKFTLDSKLMHTKETLRSKKEFMNVFENKQNAIVYQMQNQDIHIKEMQENKIIYEDILQKQKEKLDELKRQFEPLIKEKITFEKEIKEIKETMPTLPENIFENLIQLNKIIDEGEEFEKTYLNKPLLELVGYTKNNLGQIEADVIKLIEEVSECEEEDITLFNIAVQNVKKQNRIRNLKEAMREMLRVAEEKKKIKEDKFKKIVIKGRPMDLPFQGVKKKKKKKIIQNYDQVKTENLLCYEEDK